MTIMAANFGLVGLVIAAFLLGLFIGIILTLGSVQLVVRIIWHIWVMSRNE